MASFNNIVCIKGIYDVQKVEVTSDGEIKLIELFENICDGNLILDIICDEIGDFWVCSKFGFIKKIP